MNYRIWKPYLRLVEGDDFQIIWPKIKEGEREGGKKEGRKRGSKGIKREDKKEREIFSELSKAIKVGEVEAGKLILHLQNLIHGFSKCLVHTREDFPGGGSVAKYSGLEEQ